MRTFFPKLQSFKSLSDRQNLLTKIVIVLGTIFIGLFVINMFFPSFAYGDIVVGGEELKGYRPSDIIQSDINIGIDSADDVAPKIEQLVIVFVKAIIPILAIACVLLIVFNAIANIFRKKEDRKPIGELLKNIFVGFFWILFAWIIVELIIYVITSGETFIYGLLFT